MSRHFIRRAGAQLSYERRGHGPLVVLIQGLGLSGSMWLQLPGGLVKSRHTVVTPDNRGTGQSDAPAPPYLMGQLADDTAAVIEDVGQGSAIVVGISLGGMVAQHLALRHPGLVSGLVLAATTCGPPVGRPPRLRAVWQLVRSLRGAPNAVQRVRELLVHPQTLRENPRVFDQWERVMRSEPLRWTGQLGQLAAATMHSTGFVLGRIRCPTMVIAGEDDQLIPPINSRILARRIPAAELELLPRAGHAFPLEQPAAIPRAIRRVEQALGS